MVKQWEQRDTLFWGAPKSDGENQTADDDCSHEIKRRLLLGRKAKTNLNSVLKSKDVTLPTKTCYSRSYGFSSSHVWM